jgi:zinc protease
MNPLWLALACAHTPETPMIDLTQAPPVSAAPDYTPPVPTKHTLSNGAQVWIHARAGLPLVSVRLTIPGGSAIDPGDAPGVSSMTDAMLTRGAGDRDATAFATEVERLALGLGTDTLSTATMVSLDAHTERLEAGLDLLRDMLLHPRFAADDLQRLKEIQIGELTEASDDAKTIAGWTMDRLYFGEGHPLAHPTEGSVASVKKMEVADLRASWEQRYGPDNATFVVAGDVSAETILSQLEDRFGSWPTANRSRTTIPAPPVHEGQRRYFFVDKPGTSQTALRVMMPAPTMDDPASEGAELGAIILGGTFTSRLNQLLREEKGYTYGARSSYVGKREFGYLLASTNVQKEVSAPALVDLLAELKRYKTGITDDELPKAQGAWQTRAVASMESRASIASNFAGLAIENLPIDTFGTQLQAAKSADVAAVNLGIDASNMDNSIVIVVGDLEKIRTDIEKSVPVTWELVHTEH